jgi:hypothetical protein
VYRSSRMTKEQARLLFPGEKYRFGMYVCTTTRRSALGDLREWQTSEMGSTVQIVWEMEIPKGCRQASKIQAVSAHADESEVLLVPVSLNAHVSLPHLAKTSVDDVRTHMLVCTGAHVVHAHSCDGNRVRGALQSLDHPRTCIDGLDGRRPGVADVRRLKASEVVVISPSCTHLRHTLAMAIPRKNIYHY